MTDQDQMKVFQDYILTTKDTIFILQNWLKLLEKWQRHGQVDSEEFDEIYQRLSEIGLGNWIEQTSGYSLAVLRQGVGRAINNFWC